MPGDKAEYEGILLSIPKAQETRVKIIERDQFEAINNSLNKSLDLYRNNEKLYQDKIDITMKQNDTLAKNVYDLQTTSFWHNTLMFLAGCVVTTAIMYGVNAAQK